MKFTIKGNNALHTIELPDDTPLSGLQDILNDKFGISPSRQQLILKGKSILPTSNTSTTILESGIKESAKLFLFGAKDVDIQAMQTHTAFLAHKASVVEARKPIKLRSTATSSTDRFINLTPFPDAPSTPHFNKRKDFLHRLSTDPAVLHLMGKRERDWRVLELGELHPHTQPTLLGLNTNNGSMGPAGTLKIELRVLTDDLEGVRSYNQVRRVLLHELAHIVHPNHELPFKELDSLLAKELIAFYADPARKGNRLGGDILDEYNPAEMAAVGNAMLSSGRCDVEASDSSLPVGGERLGGSPGTSMSARERIAKAAEERNAKR